MALNKYKTKQETLWSGEFGDQYTVRNQSYGLLTSAMAFFSKILSSTSDVESVMEYGANIGINIQALQLLLPEAKFSALEINKQAVTKLRKIKNLEVYSGSILDFKSSKKWDFVLTRGVLIHINPDVLNEVYNTIYKSSKKYICIAEYYNPTPVSIGYHGQADALFKRDFAGELLDRFNKLRLVDYGFVYHRDNNFPQDDITWFLLEKWLNLFTKNFFV